jgi:hypothetical protein
MCFRFAAALSVLILLPAIVPAAAEPGSVAARYDCAFQPWIGGRLIDGKISAPQTGQLRQAPVRISFIVSDPRGGPAVMQIGQRQGWNTPATLRIMDDVLRFSFEFPGRSAGSATIARTKGANGYPAVHTDQGWADGHLSVGYSYGSCEATDQR